MYYRITHAVRLCFEERVLPVVCPVTVLDLLFLLKDFGGCTSLSCSFETCDAIRRPVIKGTSKQIFLVPVSFSLSVVSSVVSLEIW